MVSEREKIGTGGVYDARAQLRARAGVVDGPQQRPDASPVPTTYRSTMGAGLLVFVFIVLLVCALWAASGTYAHAAHEQGALALRESILRMADQCYAIEGAYPASLGYLRTRYGLSVDADAYDVTYEIFASNVAPTVVVRPL